MYFNGVGPQYRKRCIEEYPSDDIGVDPSDEKTQALYRGTRCYPPGGVPDRNKEMKHWRRATKSLGTEKQKETAKN